ncbi:MAG: TIGR04086 family membrane protein [Firmicutes bacterium]|nr:TIGR04086 family membrane protein [Bacillota bacterium]
MNNLGRFKKYGMSLLMSLGIIFILTFFVSIFHYFDLMKMGTVSVFKLIILLIAFFTGGFIMSISASKKGWLEGIKFAVMIAIFFLLFQLLGVEKSFQLKDLIFYFIIFISSIFGGMVGIHVTPSKK